MSGIEFRKLEQLIPDPDNARTHTPEQVEQVANSIRRFGFTMPGLVDEVIRAGNCRRAACELIYGMGETIYLAPGKERGGTAIPLGTMPVLDCTGWTAEERKAYALADNKLALNAGWNDELLTEQLRELQGFDFDLSLLGFDKTELYKLFANADAKAKDPNDLPDITGHGASRPGDVWILGDHRLLCGSCTSAEDVDSVLDGCVPRLMVTDPPYGVSYDPAWRWEQNESVMSFRNATRKFGEVENDDRADWKEAWQLFPGDVAYIWHAGNKCHIVAESIISCGFDIRAQIIWGKQHHVISRGDYHAQHEPLFYCVRKGKPGHFHGGRKQSTLWDDIDALMPVGRKGKKGSEPENDKTDHGTQKPVECMRRPIENNSDPGDLVYEPFSGSGTTIIAGEMTGRHVRAIELLPAYVDMAVLRWEKFAGKTATLAATGQSFAAVKAERELEAAAA